MQEDPWHGQRDGRGLDTLVNQGGKVDTKGQSIGSCFLNWIYSYIFNIFLGYVVE